MLYYYSFKRIFSLYVYSLYFVLIKPAIACHIPPTTLIWYFLLPKVQQLWCNIAITFLSPLSNSSRLAQLSPRNGACERVRAYVWISLSLSTVCVCVCVRVCVCVCVCVRARERGGGGGGGACVRQRASEWVSGRLSKVFKQVWDLGIVAFPIDN